MNKEMIEKLKGNIATLECLSKEEQVFLIDSPKKNVQWLSGEGKWLPVSPRVILLSTGRYRLHPDYSPEPEAVECEVENVGYISLIVEGYDGHVNIRHKHKDDRYCVSITNDALVEITKMVLYWAEMQK